MVLVHDAARGVSVDDGGTLAREFPGWQIEAGPYAWSAFWRSEDGRSRRLLVASSPAALLRMLRDIRDAR
jgi:hypothetical protein